MEEIMKYVLMACAFLFLSNGQSLYATKVRDQTNSYQQGTILSVEKRNVQSPGYNGGNNPSDAPLQSEFYAYDILVRLDCGTYVAHYESPIDYLPSAFAANQAVHVRVTKHFMYFNLPLEGESKMAIGHRKKARSAPCEATRDQR
jgi:hypothetical protein